MAFFNLHHLLQTASHQHWILPLVFLLSLLESLAVIGTFIPGATALFIAGALVGAGALNFWQTLIYSISGAIIGDGLSYWLGHHYQETIICYWPFKRYPGLLQKSEAFFAKHGGKSVVIGRFFGPVRAMVPVVAGMVRMSPYKFYTLNILSALVWAPAHILPGALLGASIVLAEAITMRLVVVILIIALLILISMWSTQFLLKVGIIRLKTLRKRLLNWSHLHDNIWSQALQNLLEPAHPSFGTLLFSVILLILGILGFFMALQAIIMQTALLNANSATYHFLQNIHLPWMNKLMLTVSNLGSAKIILPILVGMIGWLLWKKNFSATLYWLAALGFSFIVVPALKLALGYTHLLAPNPYSYYSFPSLQTTTEATVYGFTAYLFARELKTTWRMPILLTAACLILLIGFSTLYLGKNWLSDVLGGLCLGLAWVAFLAIVHTWHDPHPVEVRPLALLLLGVITASQVLLQLSGPKLTSTPSTHPEETQFFSMVQWENGKWNNLPKKRSDFGGEQEESFVIQWASPENKIKNRLAQLGWKPAPKSNIKNLAIWLIPNEPIQHLPVLPSFNDGIAANLTFVKQKNHTQSRMVLRLWKTHTYIGIGINATPVWLGSLECEKIHHLLSYLAFAKASSSCPLNLSTFYDNFKNSANPSETILQINPSLVLIAESPNN
ncbi:MAG: bifunctional DedA family/phosphatase PAP2 family protein [Proteobacteria bacterium]|nr:bifunctional DedA family/phosphatase PAP2 family protein [Pseudomonadota bacterium]MDE3207775.1 VTT domain-containing protein [Pseudomonadota bacterium]